MVTHPAIAAFINLVQHLLQRLHGRMPARAYGLFLLYLPLASVYAQHQLQAYCSEAIYSMEHALDTGRSEGLTKKDSMM